jgi:hypothetical protein
MRPPAPAEGRATRRPVEDSEVPRPAEPGGAAAAGDQDAVELSSIDSFPASDPPGWISCSATGGARRQ